PEEVRRLFKVLFDKTFEIEERYDAFKSGFDRLAAKIETEKDNHYQDHRAVMVYLCLKYPQDFYLYKFGMFRDFCSNVEYAYTPVTGDFTNVLEFQQLCSLIKAELLTDDELLNLHHKRLLNAEEFYQDPAYTLLTQDFIYACINHLDKPKVAPGEEVNFTFEEVELSDFHVKSSEPKLN